MIITHLVIIILLCSSVAAVCFTGVLMNSRQNEIKHNFSLKINIQITTWSFILSLSYGGSLAAVKENKENETLALALNMRSGKQ